MLAMATFFTHPNVEINYTDTNTMPPRTTGSLSK